MTLEEIVKSDLGNYGQDNRRPNSLTVKEGRGWRHYELGEIVGFMIYYENGGVFITQVKEDDEYWFVPILLCLVYRRNKSHLEKNYKMV